MLAEVESAWERWKEIYPDPGDGGAGPQQSQSPGLNGILGQYAAVRDANLAAEAEIAGFREGIGGKRVELRLVGNQRLDRWAAELERREDIALNRFDAAIRGGEWDGTLRPAALNWRNHLRARHADHSAKAGESG